MRGRITLVVVATLALTAAACGSGSTAGRGPVELRLGYLANLTHAPALIGVDTGIFAGALGTKATLRTQIFNAGPQAVEAIFGGALDAAFVGPGPAINAYVKSRGEAIRIVAGATSGGASLVLRPGVVAGPALKGRTLATPQLGNTQDVALRSWLATQGLRTDPQTGGDVNVAPMDNAATLEAFATGTIDGAWVPEPWATRLVVEGGGVRALDEATLWPGGRFVTTNLIVATGFLEAHPAIVRALVAGEIASINYLNADAGRALADVRSALAKLTPKALPAAVVGPALDKLTFTWDPLATTLATSAEHARAVGLLDDASLKGIYDLRELNRELGVESQAAVTAAGLGRA